MPDRRAPDVVFVQFGDFAAAVDRFAAGGEETYHSQRYSVGVVQALAARAASVTVVSMAAPAYDRALPGGIRAIGTPGVLWGRRDAREVLKLIAGPAPGAVIVRFPAPALIRACARAGARVFPLLADSFRGRSLRQRFFARRLAATLNDPAVEFAANHQLASCRDLARIGVAPAKILPWDWPSPEGAEDFPPKSGPRRPGRVAALFAGSVSEAKGVGDLIRAVALLAGSGLDATATIVGGGEVEAFRGLAAALGVAGRVDFAGLVPHREVIARMREADAVVVPSRHSYGEGLPMTVADALASRTPLVISDHPMLLGRLEGEPSVLVVPEKDPARLAAALRRLAEEPGTYRALSEAARATGERLQIPLKWGEMVERWVSGGADDRLWLSRFTLAGRDYA